MFSDTIYIGPYLIADSQVAANISLRKFIKAKNLGDPKNKRVVLYGSESQFDQLRVVADKIRQAGAQKVYIIKDGIEGFRDAGYPLEEKIPFGLLQTRLAQL